MPVMYQRMIKYFRAQMPSRAEMEENRWLAPIAHRFGRSELWRFTRRSVPRGVALGLFAGFIIPIGQIFLAAFLSLPFRANVPLAALLTFVTNPFTLPFWLLVANKLGRFALMVDVATGASVADDLTTGWWTQYGWFLETAGVTVFGLGLLSILMPVLGYVVAIFAWRLVITRKWRRRPWRYARLNPAE